MGPELVDELARGQLREWVAERICRHLIEDPLVEAAIAGNLQDARMVPSLVQKTEDRLRRMAAAR